MKRVNNSTLLRRSIAQVLTGTLAVGVAFPALAAESSVEEVTVTGTRITKPDLVSNSPVSTVTAEAIQQLNTVNLETQLRSLPQFLPGSTEYINNGNPGAATVNLRGLGSNRTLVLMDGKRLPPFGTNGAVDINLIPAALIERVDVVTGGASAVYGSDAVTGVVNFITKKDFEGLQLDANTSQYGEGDGKTTSGAITMGGKFADDRGSAVISFGYTKRDAVLQGAREYSNYFLNPVDGYRYNGTWYQYSSNIFDPGRRGGSSNAGVTRASLMNAAGTARVTRFFTPDGQLLSSAATAATQYGPNRSFNFNPTNFFQVPQNRWQALANLEYKLSDTATAYGRVFAVNSEVPTQLASSAFFGGSTSTFQVNLDNPFLSTAQRTALITAYNGEAAAGLHGVYDAGAAAGSQLVVVNGIRRRLLELGPREGISDTKTFQFTGGVRGDIGDSGWNYDVSAQYGRVSSFAGTENDVSIARARNSLLAISTPDGIVCLAGPPCAPVNIFTGNGAPDPSTGIPMTGSISQAGADYIRAAFYNTQLVQARTASASVSGAVPAVQLPTADSPLSLAFGVDWSETSVVYDPDDLTQFGGAMGQGGTSPPLTGRLDSKEFYTEAYLPLVVGKTGVENLSLEAGIRASDTNLAGSFETWKFGVEYTPVAGYRFRAMVQKAVRAPNIGEQFAPAAAGLTSVRGDPCAGAAPLTDTVLAAKCVAQGAPVGQLGAIAAPAAQQAASITGGAVALGIDLKPEEAKTYTFGLQINPESLPGFSASVDYYNIEIKGGIGSYNAQEILDNCFVNNLTEFCGLVTRNSVGELEGDGIGIQLDTRNLAELKAKGIDYTINYAWDISEFNVGLGVSGSHTLKNESKSSPFAPTIACEGLYGDTCNEPTAKDRATFSASVAWHSWDATLFVRYISSVKVEDRADDPEQTGRSIYLIESIPSFAYLDLSVQYKWNDKLRVTFAAQNLTDKDPTVVGNISGGNTSMNAYADTYDPLGRRFSIGASYKF